MKWTSSSQVNWDGIFCLKNPLERERPQTYLHSFLQADQFIQIKMVGHIWASNSHLTLPLMETAPGCLRQWAARLGFWREWAGFPLCPFKCIAEELWETLGENCMQNATWDQKPPIIGFNK